MFLTIEVFLPIYETKRHNRAFTIVKNVFELNYKSFRSLKRLAKIAALFCAFFASAAFCAMGFCTDYTWSGAAGNNNWNDYRNWDSGIEGWFAYPQQTTDNAYIAGNYTIDINENITVGTFRVAGNVTVNVDNDLTVTTLNIQKEGNNLTSSWTTKFTGSKSVAFDSMEFDRASSTGGVIGTLEVDCAMACSGTITTHSGTTLLVNSGKTLSAATFNHSASNSTPKSQITVKGTLSVAGTMDLQNNVGGGCNALAVSSGGTVTATTLTWSQNNNYTNGGNAIDNNETIKIGGALKVTGPATGSGTILMAADSSITNSGSGAVTIAKLSGAKEATVLNSGTGTLEISSYEDSPTITIANNSKNVSLDAGTLTALTVGTNATATIVGDITTTSGATNNGTLNAGASVPISGAVTNNKTIAAGAYDITFDGAVTSGASAGITTTTGKITTKAASSLGTVTIQSVGGSVDHAGSGAVSVTELVIEADAAVTNSSSGAIEISKITGAHTATLKSVSKDDGIKVDDYDTTDIPAITVDNGSKNILLYAGTIASLDVESSAKATLSGDMTVTGDVTNAGTLAANGGLTFAANFTNNGAAGSFTAVGTVTATGNAATFKGNESTIAAFVYAPTSASGAGLTVSDKNAIADFSCSTAGANVKFTGAGTSVTVSGANKYGTFSASGAGSSVTLSDANNEFTNFSMTSGGGTLTVNAAQTVGTLTLKGTGTGANVLNVNGSGSIKLGENQHSGDYLSVERLTTGGIKILPDGSSGFYYSATNSSFTAEEYLGEHNHWILLGDNMEFKWTGGGKKTDGTTADPDWSNPANWNYNLVPGTSDAAIGGVSTKENYPVLIPNTPSKNASNFPVVTKSDGYSITDLTIGESASSGAKLTVQTNGNAQGAIKLTGDLKNSGTIIYNRKGRITKGGTFINDADETTPERKGTVEFTGTVEDASDISTPSAGYYNLTISGSKNYYAAGDLTVRNALLVSGESAACTGSVWINNSDGETATSAATVRFNTSGTISLGNKADDSFEVKGGALELPAASDTLGGLTLGGKIKAGGTGIKLSMDAALAADTTFESPLTLGSTATLSAPATGDAITVTTNGALTTTAAYTLVLENANLANAGSADGANVKFTGSANRAQSFAPNASSTYKSVTIDKAKDATTASMEMTVSAELKTQSLAINQNEKTTFAGKVSVTDTGSYSDDAAAGDILFNAGCDFTFVAPKQAKFDTTGTLTLNGATNDCSFKSDLIHTAGGTELYGKLKTNGGAINFGATAIKADAEITTTNGAATFGATTLSGNLKLDAGTGEATFGTISGAKNFTSLGSGKVNFNGNIGQPAPLAKLASITVEGPVAVASACANIATSGLQHYKGDINFGGACSVAGEVQAAGSVAASGAVDFDNNVWLYTNAAATLGGAGGSLDITGNLYFVGESKTASVASNVTAKNILLLHGTVDIAAGATLASSTGDVILLGAAYDNNIDDDKDGDAASGVTGLFAYKPDATFAGKRADVSYTDKFPGIDPTKKCPDGTPVSPPGSGAVTTHDGAKISAGQNFYANGLASLGDEPWTLLLKDNDQQDSAFAEVYNSTIKNCTAKPIVDGKTVYVMAAENNALEGNCSANIVTSRPKITEAYTVYDDVIKVSFDVEIENSCNEIYAAASNIFNSLGGSNSAFAGTYTDADCQHSTSESGVGDISSFYIKAASTWNTDATGTSAGAEKSSDRGRGPAIPPEHRDTIPCLNLPKALDGLYETLRDKSKNRIAHYYSTAPVTSAVNDAPGKTFTAVADKCAPVLIKVLTGQELHAAPGSQADCDSHNFVEFVYSEPVDISGGSTSVADSDVNIQAGADLGATINNSSGITFAGLAKTAGGKIEAQLKAGSGSPHALYRNFSTAAGDPAADQEARIRVSIAGWVDGTVDGTNKNWPGYINSATSPSGEITRIANANIKDRSAAKNSLDVNVAMPGHRLPTLSVENSESELYGPWDVTPPSFAPVRITGTTTWKRPATDGSQEYEFVGASYSTGTLSAIELHWFDNEPTYTENRQWFSRVGWADASSSTEYSSVASYAADVRGGSRPDSAGANATSGGIRYCALYDANASFKYTVDGENNWHDFTQNIKAGANSSLFTYAGETPGAAVHQTGAEDGLYCKLLLDQTSYVLQTTFVLTFDSTNCFITDLAGNRINCGKITMKTIDRTPPGFTMSAVPLGTKNMMVIFSKALNTDQLTLYNSASDYRTVSALEYIPKALELENSSGTGIQIDQNVPAQCLFKTNNATGILLALNKDAVLNDITSGIFVTAKSYGQAYDPLAGVTASLTYIQDAVGNYVVADSKHAFSDFAVNAVQPQYAYDNSVTDQGSPTGYSLYQDGSWAVRDWNAEQANYGTLHAGKEVIMQASLYDGTSDKSGGLNPSGQLASGTVSAFFANKPDAASVSTKINENTNLDWRIWQPNFTSDIFGSLAPVNNKSYISINATSNDSGILFDIPQESAENWKSGDQISFVFKMGDYTVDHYADGTNYPLYAIRLKDLNDIASLDLWSFKVKSATLQRGGVTILNNVIDVNNGENTVIQVDMKEAGNLNVIVMTLDGNIVKYLRHGHTDAGTHYYNWNGTNNGGSKVARGLYFVRVIGPGIDETRKVMCVK